MKCPVLMMVLLLAACAGDNGPGPDPGLGRLLFVRVGNGLQDIYAMNLNGQHLDQLTTSFAFEDWPSWSPDTTHIVYMSNQRSDSTIPVHYHLFVMGADGSNATQLTFGDSVDSYQPAWSPDGTKIAFGSNKDGNGEIYLMDPNGTNIVRLTNDPAEDGQPVWSPDGAKIAFATIRDGNNEIYVMSANGSGPVNLTNHAGSDLAPAWSPDGTKIAFQSDRETNVAVWVMNADGSNPVRLTDPVAPSGAPSWSPDGTRILYEQIGSGVQRAAIWVMNADGSGKIQITNGHQSDGFPRWRPVL